MKNKFTLIVAIYSLLLISCKKDVSTSFIDRAELLLSINPDSSRLLLDSIAIPDNLNDGDLARWCMLSGKIADTLFTDLPYSAQLERAQKYYFSHGSPAQQAQIILYLGRAYVNDKEYDKAMHTYLSALDIALKAKDYNRAGYICSYMGDLYHFEDNHLLGKSKYQEAAYYFHEANNQRSYAFALRDVGCMYVFLDSSEVGLDYLQKAYSVVSALNDSVAMASVMNGLGNTYGMLGDLKLAEDYFLQSIQLDNSDSAPSYLALCDIYISKYQFDSARIFLQQADIHTFNEYTSTGVIYSYYKIAKEEGHFIQALNYLEDYTATSDSIREEQRKINILESEKKYSELKLLFENSQLKSERQWFFILSLAISFICLLMFAIYQIHIRRKNKRIYLQQIDIERKSSQLLRQQADLRIKQIELQDLHRKLSAKESFHLDLKTKLEKEYDLKNKEIEVLTNKIHHQQNELLLASSIAKKVIRLAEKVVPNAKESPLSNKDWKAIRSIVNEIYPNLEKKLLEANMGDSDIDYCYLSLFRLGVNREAILLHITTSSVNKRIQRVRQKLTIIGKNYDLATYLINI